MKYPCRCSCLCEQGYDYQPSTICSDCTNNQHQGTEVRPCDSCETPIPTDIHAEELGFCIKCSDDYFNHTCEKCGSENVMNLNPPFTRLCDSCEVSK